MGNLDTFTGLLAKLLSAFSVDHQAPDLLVPQAALMGLTREADYIKAKREAAIAYLRSSTPSKYIMDGARVNWHAPILLEDFRHERYQNSIPKIGRANWVQGQRQRHSS